MRNNRNAEGYYDPTAGNALANITREEKQKRQVAKRAYRPMVYICSRFAGDVGNNIALAMKYCRYAVDHNAIPVAPHLLYPQFMDDNNPKERELGLFFGIILLDKSDEIWIFSDGSYSSGMQAEYEHAIRKGYKIRYFTTDCREVISHGDGGGDESV